MLNFASSFLSFFFLCCVRKRTMNQSIDASDKVNIMSFCLCEEIYVVSFLYLDTMTKYQSEVMSFLLYVIYTSGKNKCSSVFWGYCYQMNIIILWKVGTYSENSWSFLSFCIIRFYFSSIHYRVQWRPLHVQICTEWILLLSSKLVFEIFHYYKVIFWEK